MYIDLRRAGDELDYWIELNFIIEVHMYRYESQAYNMH